MVEFKVIFARAAEKDIDGLQADIRLKVLKAIKLLEIYPFPKGDTIKKLKGAKIPTYRLRVGDFRIVYHINGTDVVIFFIVDRKDFEKKFKAFDLPPKKWTLRRGGGSITTGPKTTGGVQWMGRTTGISGLTGILRFQR